MSRDESDVRATLTGWYTAMSAHDITAVGAALSESFLLVEHDQLLDRDQLIEMLSVGLQQTHALVQRSRK